MGITILKLQESGKHTFLFTGRNREAVVFSYSWVTDSEDKESDKQEWSTTVPLLPLRIETSWSHDGFFNTHTCTHAHTHTHTHTHAHTYIHIHTHTYTHKTATTTQLKGSNRYTQSHNCCRSTEKSQTIQCIIHSYMAEHSGLPLCCSTPTFFITMFCSAMSFRLGCIILTAACEHTYWVENQIFCWNQCFKWQSFSTMQTLSHTCTLCLIPPTPTSTPPPPMPLPHHQHACIET